LGLVGRNFETVHSASRILWTHGQIDIVDYLCGLAHNFNF